MGFTPKDIQEMSLWEYSATMVGWKQANSTGEEEAAQAPSDEEFFAIVERYAD